MNVNKFIASDSFWEGIAYFFSPIRTFDKKICELHKRHILPNPKKSAWEEDKAALRSDYEAIARDFRMVFDDFAKVTDNYGRRN